LKIFIYVFMLAIFSIFLAAVSFYLSLFLAWGRLIDVSTGMTVAILIGLVSFFLGIKLILTKGRQKPDLDEEEVAALQKKENNEKRNVLVAIGMVVSLMFLFYYAYSVKNRTKLYSYSDFPCQTSLISSEKEVDMIKYIGSSMSLFEKITPYNLESRPYYDIIKKNTGHKHVESYPIGATWRIIGLYQRTTYNLDYFLLESTVDNKRAWLYTNNFNYLECRIEAIDRENPFKRYPTKGERKEITSKSTKP